MNDLLFKTMTLLFLEPLSKNRINICIKQGLDIRLYVNHTTGFLIQFEEGSFLGIIDPINKIVKQIYFINLKLELYAYSSDTIGLVDLKTTSIASEEDVIKFWEQGIKDMFMAVMFQGTLLGLDKDLSADPSLAELIKGEGLPYSVFSADLADQFKLPEGEGTLELAFGDGELAKQAMNITLASAKWAEGFSEKDSGSLLEADWGYVFSLPLMNRTPPVVFQATVCEEYIIFHLRDPDTKAPLSVRMVAHDSEVESILKDFLKK